jgi:hypothetical protein
MTPYERELFFELAKKYKDEKRKKEAASFKAQVKFLGFLVISLVVILALLGSV